MTQYAEVIPYHVTSIKIENSHSTLYLHCEARTHPPLWHETSYLTCLTKHIAHTLYEQLFDDFCASAIISYPVCIPRENQTPFRFSTIISHCRLVLPRRTLWQNYPMLISKGGRKNTFDARKKCSVCRSLQLIQSWRTRERAWSVCCQGVNISCRFIQCERKRQNAAALPIDFWVASSAIGQHCDPKPKRVIKVGGCGNTHV